jgi:RimJ/RimL family protein N-acetyltransferase
MRSIMNNAPATAQLDFTDGRCRLTCGDQAVSLPAQSAGTVRAAFFLALAERRVAECEVNASPVLSSMALKPGWAQVYFRLQDDADLARLVRLPRHASPDESRAWISCERSAGRDLYAVMHMQHGMVGAYGLQRWGEAATFYFWLGKEFRGRGYGRAVVALLKQRAGALGVRRLYSTIVPDNTTSLRLLGQLEFHCLPGLEEVGSPLSHCLYGALGNGPRAADSAALHAELDLLLAAAGRGLTTTAVAQTNGANA